MNKRIDFISFEEFQKLYKAEKDKQMKLFILLAFGSGLRISEIVGFKRRFKQKKGIKEIDNTEIPPLTVDMIDMQKHQIRIDEAKGGKWRIVPLPTLFKSSHLSLLPLKLKRRTINNRLAALSIKIIGKKISPHTLRHGFGNFMVNVQHLPLPMVQQMMGHSRLDTTGIYTKANPQDAINAAWKAMGGE